MFLFFAILTGKVTHDAIPLLGCWLLGGFVVQAVVAILDLKGGNHTGGNTFLYFSAFFMLVGGLEMIMKYNMTNAGTTFDAHIDGWAWMVLTDCRNYRNLSFSSNYSEYCIWKRSLSVAWSI